MAPPSKKTEQKAKAKIVEDKTFGLKNKNKSAKVSKYIASVEAQVKNIGKDRQARKAEEQLKKERETRKDQTKKEQELLNQLFKPVVQPQKVPFGVDPKTVLCQYFKAGACTKGDKCKFSHDLGVERKSTKINLYQDARDSTTKSSAEGIDAAGTNSSDTLPAITTQDSMQDWDQNKLEQVVLRKHGPGIKTTTDIVCKYFLDAIEQRKYGWFWECPNGGDKCKYRHALPPGFVLRSDTSATSKAKDDADHTISLEEFLETERYKIKKTTPVTADSFAKWKQDRKRRAEEEEQKTRKAREAEVKAGRLGNVSGRDLFVYQPDLFADDDEAMDVDYKQRNDSENEQNDNGVIGDEGEEAHQGTDSDLIDNVHDESLFLNEVLDDFDISKD